MKAEINFEDAHEDLKEYDVLIVPGGVGVDDVLKKDTEPIKLIQDFAKLQQTDPSKERTLMSIGTGSLILAHAGLLQGLAATTHPDYYTKMEIICKEAARRGDLEQTDVMEENYVVNNARFDLGEKLEENPFVLSKRPDGRRKSIARKGSNAWKESVKRRESNARRASLRLGGLRVITSGGVSGISPEKHLNRTHLVFGPKIFLAGNLFTLLLTYCSGVILILRQGSMLTRKSAGDEWLGCEPVSCGGYGFTRLGSRGGEIVTV